MKKFGFILRTPAIKKFTVLLVHCLVFFSCGKIFKKPECEKEKFGWLIVTNKSTFLFNVFVDDVFKVQLKAKENSGKMKIDEGLYHRLYVKQVSGAFTASSEKTKRLDVSSCTEYTWDIP